MTSGQGDLRIILLGKTGAGKSASGNTILGRNAFKETSKICEKHEGDVDGKNIVVFDTPGLFNASITKEQVKSEIEMCVEMSAPGPHVFLLVIKLGVRFTEEERNSVQWIQENFGEEALLRTIILFTHIDLLKGRSLEEYIKKSHHLPKILDSCGGRYHSFNNEDRNNQHQITELLKKINKLRRANGMRHYTPEMLRTIQTEIAGKDQGLTLLDNKCILRIIIIVIGVIFLGTQLRNNWLQNEEVKLKNDIEQIKQDVQQLTKDIQECENRKNLLNKNFQEKEREEQTLNEMIQKSEQEEKQLRNELSQKEEDYKVLKNKIQEKEQEENQLISELPQKEQEDVWLKNDLQAEEEQQLIKELLQKEKEKHQLKNDLLEKKQELLQKEQEKWQIKNNVLEYKQKQYKLRKELEQIKQEKQKLEKDHQQNEQNNHDLKNKHQQKEYQKHQLEKKLRQYNQKVQ